MVEGSAAKQVANGENKAAYSARAELNYSLADVLKTATTQEKHTAAMA